MADLAAAILPHDRHDVAHLTWPEPSPTADAADATSTEARLRLAEHRFKTLVEQIPAVTFMAVLGQGKNEVYVSPHVEQMLGFTQKEWLEDPAGAQVPDRDSLQADACGPSYRYDSHTRLALERKEDMRRRNVPSPDEWDAVALTFAEPVRPTAFARKIEYPSLGVV